MSDNLTLKNPEDSKKINISQDWEISYWTKKLDVTDEEIRAAVGAVGPLVADVKKFLQK